MKDFFQRNKVFIIITFITCALIAGGTFLMSGNGNSDKNKEIVLSTTLVPEDAFKTSGFVDGNYVAASASATVTLVEFGDYVCPACGVYAPYIKQLLTDYPGKITYVFRNYPLSYHSNATEASYAALAAGLQGKYWEMHEKIYETQSNWSEISDPKSVFSEYVKELNLDVNQFLIDIDSQSVKDIVVRDTNDGNTVKLKETPTFYINGEKVTNLSGPEDLQNLLKSKIVE